MSIKFLFVFTILTFAAIILEAEARGGRGRGGSFGTTFYRRSYKKNNNNNAGRGSRRKVVSGSPVHTTYTKSLTAADSIDLKFGKHSKSRSRNRHTSTSHTSHPSTGHSDHSTHNTYNSHSSSKHADTSHNSHGQSGAQPYHTYNTHNSLHSFNSLGPRNSYHNSPHTSQNWGGHQLPAGHVYITQPSSIPPHAVYYAQPPRYSSTADDTIDFVRGYLIGSSLTRPRHHHHNHHHYEQDTSHRSYNEFAEDNTNSTASSDKGSSTERTHYWPTDNEVSLAPLNNTLLPVEATQATQPAIFKGPPKLTAQKLAIDNSTIELPEATAPTPDVPPANGIICMPWTFNETDPNNLERIVSVERTICFPAPPAPPAPPMPTTPPPTPAPSTAPVAGDIGVDVHASTPAPKDNCKDAVCPSDIHSIDFTNINFCCLKEDRLLAMTMQILGPRFQ